MTHIMQRRDTAATWTSVNPVLYDGESGHESDTGREKMGDGVTAWTALPYKYGVDSVAGKTGEVDLVVADVAGAIGADSPVFTGNPTAPTPNPADNDTTIATTAFVKSLGYVNADDMADAIADAVAAAVDATKLALYPIGSLYIAEHATDPGTFIGGTWEQYAEARTLVGRDPGGDTDFDTAGETGGVKEVTLTADQSGLPEGLIVQQLNGGPLYFNVGSDADPTHRATYIGPANATDPHTNLPPYIVVNIWRRTS